MEPALRPGDWLLVWRGLVPGRPLRVRSGQVVIADHPMRPSMLLVKRATKHELGGWFLSSDNLDAGAVDSNQFGPVAQEAIRGRVLLRYCRSR
jgi:hypothetical protein